VSVVSLHLLPTISKTTREAKADKLEADKSAAISAELTAKIEAKIEAEAKWLFFHVKAGANATVASAKSIDVGAGIKGEMTFAPPKKEGEALDFSGDVICTGAAVYLGVYAETNIKKDTEARSNTDTTGGGIADGEESENHSQTTTQKEGAFKVERSCNFVILNEFSFKDVLLNNTPPPPLTQYPQDGIAVGIRDDLYVDAAGNIVGAMDNHATMPSMTKPHF
jgi:flagellar hook protein FlgE